MIFTKDLTLRDVVNIIHEQVGEDYRFIYRTECYDDHVVLNEANIDQDELGICYKQKASRFVMITGSSNSKHHGRMKVSARGIPINRTNKDKYISIYRKNKNTIPPSVTKSQIEEAFSAVKSGTQSSVKGGDTLLEQDKVVSKHASIINVNLVHTTFVKIENIFENFIKTNNRQDFIDSLQLIFVNNTKGQRTIDKLSKVLESDARQAIEDIIQSMRLDIT